MIHQDGCFALPPKAVEALTNTSLGKLTPVLQRDDTPTDFTLWDTFDHAVASKHVLLIETVGRLELLTGDASVVTQDGKRAGNFVADLSDGPVKSALSHVPPLRSLLPLATGTAWSTAMAFVDDEQKTQARLTLRELSTADTNGLAIVTLSGLRGYDKALERLRAHVIDLGGKPLEAATAYGHLIPNVAPFVARPALPIKADDPIFATETAIIAAHLPLARCNEAGMLNDTDTEFLHHYRVALRKIRSVLSLFKGVYTDAQTVALKSRFSALMAPTGRLRDLDVYLLDRQTYYDLVPASVHGGLDQMFDMFAAERKRELTRLRKHLRSRAYEKDIAQLERLFKKGKALKPGPKADQPAHAYASKLIWKRYVKICTIAEAITDATPDEEVHELRIQCKKLRYLMEFFAPIYPSAELKPLIKSLKRLQDTLGLFNDYAVQQLSLQDFIETIDDTAPGAMELAQAVGALIAVLHRRQMEERAKVTERFVQFNSPETQQSFRDLFHGGKA